MRFQIKLNLESHKFGDIVVETDKLYLCELVPAQIKTTVKETKMLSLRILRIILIAGLIFLVSRKLLSKLSTQIDANRYSKIRSSLDSNKLIRV